MQRPVALRLLWFFSLGGMGIHFPYYSLYLRENAGLSGSELGLVLAVVPLVGIAAQPFWGQLADRSGARTLLLALIAAGTALTYAALGLASGFSALLLGTAGLACFSTGLVPGCVAVTLALTRAGGPGAFGRARVFGTLGFGLLVVGFPPLLDAYQRATGLTPVPGGPSEPGLGLMFPIGAGWTAFGALAALALPRGGAVALRAARGDWRELLVHGPFLRALLFLLLVYVCVQGPMAQFPNLVRHYGGSLESVSRMWIAMLALEVPLIAFSGLGLARVGPRGLLAVAVLAAGARWVVCGLAATIAWLYAASLLHGVIVAGLLVGAPLYVDAVVPERLRSTAQALLAMVSVGIGGGISNAATGWLFEHAGARVPYWLGGCAAIVLAAALPLFLPPARRAEPPPG